jgi:hypothetical protein
MRKPAPLQKPIQALTLLYIPAVYLSILQGVKDVPYLSQAVGVGLLLVGASILAASSATGGKNWLLDRRLNSIYLYSLVVAICILLSCYWAPNQLFSLTRGLVSVFLFITTFTVFWYAVCAKENDVSLSEFLVRTLILLSLFLLAGQVSFDSWASGIGGIRMSGGTNPNQVAFLGLLGVFVGNYEYIKNPSLKREARILGFISVVMVVWSLSRSNIGSLVALYMSYWGLLFLGYSSRLLMGRFRRQVLLATLSIGLLTSTIVYLVVSSGVFGDLQLLELAHRRVTGEGGFDSREAAWDEILPYFYANPLFGSAGWWHSTEIISQYAPTYAATSPHNLYVRLLAEVGIVGTVAILTLPVILFAKLSVRGVVDYFRHPTSSKIKILCASMILAILAGQLFEDRYFTSVGGFGNAVIIWVLTTSMYCAQRDRS